MSGPIVPFSCIAGQVQSITGVWTTTVGGVLVNPATNDSIVAAVSICDGVPNRANPDFPVAPQTIGILVRPSSVVTFDGIVGDRLHNLPRGFVLTEITIDYTKWFAVIGAGYSITLQQGSVIAPYTYAPVLNSVSGVSTVCGTADNKRTRTSLEFEASFNYLSALYDPYGFSIANYQDTSLGPNFIGLSGKYFQWSLTIVSDTDSGGPGDIINLSDVAGKFLQITELLAYWQEYETILGQEVLTLATPLTITIILLSATLLTFVMPDDVPRGKKIIIVGKGNGVEFSGYTPLLVLNANLVDGSGIYTLVDDKRNDTYYDRSVAPVDTVDVKIPNPLVKTGFFNG